VLLLLWQFPLLLLLLLLVLLPGHQRAATQPKAGHIRHLEVGGDTRNVHKSTTHARHTRHNRTNVCCGAAYVAHKRILYT
jgi:hypothetical protein